MGASFNQRLASVVAGVLDEVLLEAGRQILRLVLPFGSVGVGVAGVENLGVHARQFGRNLKVEVRNLLGGRLQDVAGQNRVDDAAGILDGDALASAVPAGVDEVRLRAVRLHLLDQLFAVLGRVQFEERLTEALFTGL